MAKRYLCFKDQNYHNNLSEASKVTLTYQGGRMEVDEALIFEKGCPNFSIFSMYHINDNLSYFMHRP
jgi:predicted HD phosphohydrolase